MKETLFDGRLTVTSGDITLLHVDAIVNAAIHRACRLQRGRPQTAS